MKEYKLNNKIEVWDKVEVENNLGEIEHKFNKIKSLWADIFPLSGSKKNDSAEIIMKVIIRKLSLKNINNSMYFIYKGQRLDIDYYLPRFDNNSYIEIYCKMVI